MQYEQSKRIHLIAGIFLVFLLCVSGSSAAKDLAIIAGPYLQYPTQTTMTVCWETNQPAASEAAQGKSVDALTWASAEGENRFHAVTFEGLDPAGYYFYQVRSKDSGGATVESEIFTFQTAVAEDAPFSFVVISDTQANPEIVSKLAGMAWDQRPHFTVLTGDLVSDGMMKRQWNSHFFANMHALNTRVPLIPCLGNHDKDSPFYYNYFALPDPEYRYTFTYGNAAFFVLDSQRPLEPGSEQYTWLDGALAESKATWKIVCLHKAAYSSDENDFGDTTTKPSAFGDLRLRPLSALYEKHHVDIAWCGHIHSYERTYPLVQGAPVLSGGVVYMITGGGGGGLEKAGPWRSPFAAKVYSGHHYCLVNVFGPALRIEAYTSDGLLFDFLEIDKSR